MGKKGFARSFVGAVLTLFGAYFLWSVSQGTIQSASLGQVFLALIFLVVGAFLLFRK